MLDKLPQRIQDKIVPVTESGCWLWIGAWDRLSYGNVWWGGRYWKAHTLVWTLLRGIIPRGLEIDHFCRVHCCVNPDHLEPVTHQVNVLRGTAPAAVHALKTVCPSGHLYTEENTYIDKKNCRHCKACHLRRENDRTRNRRRDVILRQESDPMEEFNL